MKLLELPVDILVENVFSRLDANTLVRLSLTCQELYRLCNDEHLWKHLVSEDYNIPRDASFRHSGWKSLYARLSDSRVYTWGENRDARLGHGDPFAAHRIRGRTISMGSIHRVLVRSNFPNAYISTPTELTALRGKGIVDIVAGGWSFHALDRKGQVWMWGRLQDGIIGSSLLGIKHVPTPERVELPGDLRVRSISCGRSHAIALGNDGSIWHWNNRWKPQRVRITNASRIVQVAANWGYSTVLTETGELFTVPEPDPVSEEAAPLQETVVQSRGVSLRMMANDPLSSIELKESDDKFVQIAGLEKCTIGLSRYGRVFKMSTENADNFIQEPGRLVVELPKFGATGYEYNDRIRGMQRFITGQFRNFAVYSADGKVLLGHQDEPATQDPQVLDELQGNICKVSFGDYHSGALTNQGDLLTWGSYSAGALGRGEDQSDSVDTVKKVEALNDMFVFAIGFGGWHSSVLAIPRA